MASRNVPRPVLSGPRWKKRSAYQSRGVAAHSELPANAGPPTRYMVRPRPGAGSKTKKRRISPGESSNTQPDLPRVVRLLSARQANEGRCNPEPAPHPGVPPPLISTHILIAILAVPTAKSFHKTTNGTFGGENGNRRQESAAQMAGLEIQGVNRNEPPDRHPGVPCRRGGGARFSPSSSSPSAGPGDHWYVACPGLSLP